MSERRPALHQPARARAGTWPGWRSAADGQVVHGLDPRPWLTAWWAEEHEKRRLFNLIPVGIGLGVCLYFAADVEPALWAPVAGLLVGALLFRVARRSEGGRLCALALGTVMLGFLAAGLRVERVDKPVLARITVGPVQGFVESVEPRPGGARIILQVTGKSELGVALPQRIRVTTTSTSLKPGDHIRANARLLPPPEPARPGGYDFARDAWFKQIGAVGSLNGEIAQVPPERPPGYWLRLAMQMDAARTALTQRIASWGPGQSGAVAAALVTGQRGLITEETNAALRAAGIYHIVSISGLHMVLAAGTIFWLFRALLAALPGVALAWPVKKIAAVFAMIGATGYCVFSGSEVAAERSLIMTLVMLGAILADRPALSMRNLAIAAIIVLLIEPEQIAGPSFQMSFAAVALLIAGAEAMRQRRESSERSGASGAAAVLLRATIGLIATTLIASVATIPFSTYHFQAINPYGLLGNGAAVPIVSILVMPAAVAGVLLYPFGLDGLAWWVMGQGLQATLALSHLVAGLNGASVMVPAFPGFAIGLIASGLTWFAVWTSPLRWLGVLPFVIGLAMARNPPVPDIFIARDGAGAMLRDQTGAWRVLGRPSAFTLRQWLAAAGDSRQPNDPALRQARSCDLEGCTIRLADGRSVAFASTRQAVLEDCQRADLVITPLVWRQDCATVMADRTRLAQTGAVTIRLSPNGWHFAFARPPGEERRWQSTRPVATPTLPAQPAASFAPADEDELTQ